MAISMIGGSAFPAPASVPGGSGATAAEIATAVWAATTRSLTVSDSGGAARQLVSTPLRLLNVDGSPINALISLGKNNTAPARQVLMVDADNRPLDLTGATVEYLLVAIGGTTKVAAPAQIVSAPGGIASYDWQSGDTDTPGLYREYWNVTIAGDTTTLPGSGSIVIEIRPAPP